MLQRVGKDDILNFLRLLYARISASIPVGTGAAADMGTSRSDILDGASAGGNTFDVFKMREHPDVCTMRVVDRKALDQILEGLAHDDKSGNFAAWVQKQRMRLRVSTNFQSGPSIPIDG